MNNILFYYMCVNLETSIISFLTGEYFGWNMYKSNVKEYQILGIFIMFFTLIQLIEACIYYFGPKWYKFLNKLLIISLGLQGLVLFYAHQKILNQQHFLIYLTLIISIIIICNTINNKYIVKESKCLDWNFFQNNKQISDLIFWMYISVLILLSSSKKYIVYRNYLLFTYFISKFIVVNKNSPSMWCLSSALITPIFYFNHVN